MSLSKVSPGENLPEEINVIIEIPANANPVKYEIDKKSGALFVDRFMSTCMHYPSNYGYIPNTLSDDGDPVDVLVPTPFALLSGSVITCRPVGQLMMTDESGTDVKVLAVPLDQLSPAYKGVKSIADMPELLLKQIQHFFEHYKDLEPEKWVRVGDWQNVDAARQEIMDSIKRYNDAPEKPAF